MKRLRRARLSRAVAKALCALLMAPQLLIWSASQTAAQQRTDRTVIVIDFNNMSGVDGPLLGRRAAAAMSLQLRESDLWDPVSQSDTDQKIHDLNLHAPFERTDLQTLARSLDANAVLFGDVVSASVSNNPAQATVKIVVKLMDVGSGELINGAAAVGTASHIGLESATDVLLDEALSKAAFAARQNMERYQLPEGTILNTTVVGNREDAYLNIGARQGVKLGMRFVVLRGRELVGYCDASNIDSDKTVATITQNFRGVKPEDLIRAIYTLPADAMTPAAAPAAPRAQNEAGPVVSPTVTPPTQSHHRSLTGPIRILAGMALALGIFAIAARTGHGGGTQPSGIVAQATRVSAGTAATSAAVRIAWQRPSQITSNAIVQYQIYRLDPLSGVSPVLIGVAFESDREFFDTTAMGNVVNFYVGTGGDAGGVNGGPQAVPPIVPGRSYRYYLQTIYVPSVSLNTNTGTTAGTTTGTTTGGTTTTGTTTATTTTGTTTTGTTTTGTTTTGTTTTTTGGTGATTGSTAANSGTGVAISAPSSASGQVTPLVPPPTTSPADQATGIDLTSVTFTWQTVAGADSYAIQASADPTNANSYQTVATYINPSRTGGQSVSRTVNLSDRFAGRSLLAWRVGAKNSQDVTPPVGGYVFSDIASFTPLQAGTAAVHGRKK